jgi:hypothetical protein
VLIKDLFIYPVLLGGALKIKYFLNAEVWKFLKNHRPSQKRNIAWANITHNPGNIDNNYSFNGALQGRDKDLFGNGFSISREEREL